MGIYTTKVIFILSMKKPAKKSAKFQRIMDLDFNPYIAKGQPLGLEVNNEELSVIVSKAKRSEIATKLPIVKKKFSPSPYTMWVTLTVANEAIFSFFTKQLESDSKYKRI